MITSVRNRGVLRAALVLAVLVTGTVLASTTATAIGADSFTVLVIGKDGGEKLRVNDVPDLQSVYDLIDGMPVRSREMSTDRRQC